MVIGYIVMLSLLFPGFCSCYVLSMCICEIYDLQDGEMIGTVLPSGQYTFTDHAQVALLQVEET